MKSIINPLLFCLALLISFPLLCQANNHHTTSPADGETIDCLSTVNLYFDQSEVADIYQPEDARSQRWIVRNEAGDSVAGAYIVIYEYPQAIVKVQPSLYAQGTYTIQIPEGFLWLYDINGMRTIAEAETLTYRVSGEESAPVFSPNFTPSPAVPVSYLSEISFTVDGIVAYGVDYTTQDKISLTDAEGHVAAYGQPNFTYGSDEEPAKAIITLDHVISTAGDYTLHIPDNLFRLGDDWPTFYLGGYDMLSATEVTYTVAGSDVTPFELIEGDGASACPGLELLFPTHQTIELTQEFACYTVYNADGYWRNNTNTWDNLITSEGNVLSLQFATSLTTPDTYKLTIPEGELRFEDGTTNTPISITFTVIATPETQVSCEPADGSTVNELYALKVTFVDATHVEEHYSSSNYPLTDEAGQQVTDNQGNELSFIVDGISGNVANMRLTNGYDYTDLTTPGRYTLTLTQGHFFLDEQQTQTNSEIKLTFNVEEGEDTHTYVSWGYYDGDDITTLSALGAEVDTYHVAIFVPGDGVLRKAKLAGAKIPVRDANVVTRLSAWIAPRLQDNNDYVLQATIGNPHAGYNTVRFDEPFTVPAEGCYLGYTIEVDNTTIMGPAYPVVFDESNKVEGSLWLSIPGYSWYDYSTSQGCSALQGLFLDLDLSEASATFGSIENGVTQAGTISDWRFPITTNSESDVTLIEYTIDIEGQCEERTAVVNIPAGYKQQGYATVGITSPEELGDYTVRLIVNKINGKVNALCQTSVSTFSNVMRTVTRRTVVEELTGTGCGWCPRGMIGMQKLREAYGEQVISIAFHNYNQNDPMWCDYASTDDLPITSAPRCAIDRKDFADPYFGNESTQNGIVDEVAEYLALPATADLTMRAVWTNTDCNEIHIESNLEAFADDDYELVYVLTADSLTAESATWRQTNYYAQYSADNYPADLALFCKGGDFGQSYFQWTFDDVVIGSSYNEQGQNLSSDRWTLQAGEVRQGNFDIALPQSGSIVEAINASIDRVYAIVIALDGRHQVAQAAKVNVVEVASDGIETVASDVIPQRYYDLMGRPIGPNAHLNRRTIIVSSDGSINF